MVKNIPQILPIFRSSLISNLHQDISLAIPTIISTPSCFKELCIFVLIHRSCCSDVVFLPAAVVRKQEHTGHFMNTYTTKSIQQIDSLCGALQACLHKHYCSFLKLSSGWNMSYWFQLFSLSGSLLLPRPCKRTSRVLVGSQHMLRSQVQLTA